MKKYSYIAGALAIVTMTGCAEFHDTNEFVVEKPESIKTYEYLNDYAALNSYVDRQAHPNFKLGVGMNGSDYYSLSGLYALACSNFDMYVPYADMMYGTAVANDGTMTLDGARKLVDAAQAGNMDVYGYALTSTSNHNGTYMRSIFDNAVAALGEDQKVVDFDMHYGDLSEYPYSTASGLVPKIQDGVLFAKFANKKHQLYLVEGLKTSAGLKYDLTFKAKSSKNVSATLHLGAADVKIKVPITTNWGENTVSFDGVDEDFFAYLDMGNTKLDLEVEYTIIKHQRELTIEESQALYINEMNRWVNSLIDNTGAKVTNWCLTNEPLAKTAGEDGKYALRHAPAGAKNECYWQDVMGDVEYVKYAYEAAKAAHAEYGGEPADLKFYVSENCCDDPAKLESLVEWIGKWEGAGVKIDGIGTKLHLECDQDAAQLSETKAKVAAHLEALAATGRMVLVQELDITLVDLNGTVVATAAMTLADQQAIADCYKWFVSTYFDKVPAAQQAGICQWTVSDGTSPKGLWSADLARIPAFGGFADGLAGK